MANTGNHEQHVKAGQQSHKNSDSGNSRSAPGRNGSDSDTSRSSNASGRSNSSDNSRSSGTQGGTHEQHVNAGRQSHKNS